jgi:hypothetical protein
MKLKTRSVSSLFAMTGIAMMAVVAGSINQAQAATISTLFSTGSTGTGIIADGATDTHYTITNPSGTTSQATATRNSAWIPNTATSAWIGPVNGANTGAVGDYVYTTTFDLTGFDASSAIISGTWSADNFGTKIRLNNTDLAFINPSYLVASTFNINSGFTSGSNTLSFFVTNSDGPGVNPTGLQVQLSGSANLATVPEPSELLGTTLAFGSLVLLKRKMAKKAK